jgi:hypothetical protein
VTKFENTAIGTGRILRLSHRSIFLADPTLPSGRSFIS